jgi:hypothetical protein
MHRALPVLLLMFPLGGCEYWAEPPLIGTAANAASVAVFGRAVGDLVVSGASGRDCSVVRLEQGKSYCAPVQPPPVPPPLCTRSLGVVDCWSNPEALNGPAVHGVADGPSTLTPAQETDRTARWPKL